MIFFVVIVVVSGVFIKGKEKKSLMVLSKPAMHNNRIQLVLSSESSSLHEERQLRKRDIASQNSSPCVIASKISV